MLDLALICIIVIIDDFVAHIVDLANIVATTWVVTSESIVGILGREIR